MISENLNLESRLASAIIFLYTIGVVFTAWKCLQPLKTARVGKFNHLVTDVEHSNFKWKYFSWPRATEQQKNAKMIDVHGLFDCEASNTKSGKNRFVIEGDGKLHQNWLR